MVFWRRGEPDLDLDLPQRWATRRGPLVPVEVTGTGQHQAILTRLHRQVPTGAWLAILAYPEPDDPHEPNAVAVLAAGHLVGYLPPAYAALWQPVIRSEHQRARIVGGLTQLSVDPQGGIDLRAWLTQPAPSPDRALPPPQQVPVGTAYRSDVWAGRTLTRALRRQQAQARTRADFEALLHTREQDSAWQMVRGRRRASAHQRYLAAQAQARAARSPNLWQREMTATEAMLFHYLAQWPDPFIVEAQVPIGYRRVDFLCRHAMLVIEVDGPEHQRAPARQADRVRDRDLRGLGLATVRVRNDDVQADPAGVASDLFTRACRRGFVAAPTDPRSPYYGWVPRPPLRPESRPDP